jgi:hypothetical protein
MLVHSHEGQPIGIASLAVLGHRAHDLSLVVFKEELGQGLVDCVEVLVGPSAGVSFAALRIVIDGIQRLGNKKEH